MEHFARHEAALDAPARAIYLVSVAHRRGGRDAEIDVSPMQAEQLRFAPADDRAEAKQRLERSGAALDRGVRLLPTRGPEVVTTGDLRQPRPKSFEVGFRFLDLLVGCAVAVTLAAQLVRSSARVPASETSSA